MNEERQEPTVAQITYPLLFADTHRLDRSLLTLRVLTVRPEAARDSEVAEAAAILAAYCSFVLQELDELPRSRVPRIGDAAWGELFLASDRRLIAVAIGSLENIGHGGRAARDIDVVERLLNELQRRRRACDTYEEITSYDRALDLL